MSLFEELKWRNLIVECSDEQKARQLLDSDIVVKCYCGFDATANSLTIGHLVQIITFLLLQKHGHYPVILLGGATSLIGDPKVTKERQLLLSEQILKNIKKITLQFQKFLSCGKFEILNNYDWLSKIDVLSFLRQYGKKINVNYMLNKETISTRLQKGLSYAEFSYMILQSIDFYYLFKFKNVQIQFGGSDQWGNITSGLELIKKIDFINYDNKPVGITNNLLLKADGTKFGKSEEGILWLDKELTSPYQIYQYFINTDDKEVINYLKSLTLLSKKVIIDLQRRHFYQPKHRVAQKMLAQEIVVFLYGKEVFGNCFRVNQILFTDNTKLMDPMFFHYLKDTVCCMKVKEKISLLDALVLTKLVSSKNKARELISSKAIAVFDKKVIDTELILSVDDALFNKYILLKKGKKFYSLLIFQS